MLIQLCNAKILKNLSVYVYKCFQIRNETLLNPWSNFLFFHADSVIVCISLQVLVMLVEILLNMYFIFSRSACFFILLKICSFMLVLNAIRHIWHSHAVRYDNVINQGSEWPHWWCVMGISLVRRCPLLSRLQVCVEWPSPRRLSFWT